MRGRSAAVDFDGCCTRRVTLCLVTLDFAQYNTWSLWGSDLKLLAAQHRLMPSLHSLRAYAAVSNEHKEPLTACIGGGCSLSRNGGIKNHRSECKPIPIKARKYVFDVFDGQAR